MGTRRTDPALPLDIVLHTPGGLVLASLQIARAVRHHKGKVTVFVPHYGRPTAGTIPGRLPASGRGVPSDSAAGRAETAPWAAPIGAGAPRLRRAPPTPRPVSLARAGLPPHAPKG